MTKDYAKSRSKLIYKRHNHYQHHRQNAWGLPNWVWMLFGLIFGILLSTFIFWKSTPPTQPAALSSVHAQNNILPIAKKMAKKTQFKTQANATLKNTPVKKIKIITTTENKAANLNLDVNKEIDPPIQKQTALESRFDFYTLLPTISVDPTHTDQTQIAKKSILPYILQAGSFKTQAQADQLKAVLALQGLEAHIQTVIVNPSESWYRVYIGPFNTKADALGVQHSLENGPDQGPNQNLNSVILKMRV